MADPVLAWGWYWLTPTILSIQSKSTKWKKQAMAELNVSDEENEKKTKGFVKRARLKRTVHDVFKEANGAAVNLHVPFAYRGPDMTLGAQVYRQQTGAIHEEVYGILHPRLETANDDVRKGKPPLIIVCEDELAIGAFFFVGNKKNTRSVSAGSGR